MSSDNNESALTPVFCLELAEVLLGISHPVLANVESEEMHLFEL